MYRLEVDIGVRWDSRLVFSSLACALKVLQAIRMDQSVGSKEWRLVDEEASKAHGRDVTIE